MILCNHNDIEKDSTYSFLLGRLESPELEDITSVANKMLQLFDNSEGKDIKDKISFRILLTS